MLAAVSDTSIEELKLLSQTDFSRLSLYIHDRYGINISKAKKHLLEARLRKRLKALSFGAYSDYCDFLFSEEGQRSEVVSMIDRVTTNKTDFFRESEHFTFLVEHAVPEILRQIRDSGEPPAGGEALSGNRAIQLWSAACSTGEEPYTLAMVLSEYAERLGGLRFDILASDISTRALEEARSAVYRMDRIQDIPTPLRKKYLLRGKDDKRDLVRVKSSVRQHVTFRRLNLMDDDLEVGRKMHVIFCRNVLIYFDKPTQHRVLSRLCRRLRDGGFLFTGHSESLFGLDLPLVQQANSVYRKLAARQLQSRLK